MRYIGVDLHKRLLVACVMEVQGGRRLVVMRGRWSNQDTKRITEFLREHMPCQVVIEATGGVALLTRAELCATGLASAGYG